MMQSKLNEDCTRSPHCSAMEVEEGELPSAGGQGHADNGHESGEASGHDAHEQEERLFPPFHHPGSYRRRMQLHPGMGLRQGPDHLLDGDPPPPPLHRHPGPRVVTSPFRPGGRGVVQDVRDEQARQHAKEEREKEELHSMLRELTRYVSVQDAMRSLDTVCVDLKKAIKKLDKLLRKLQKKKGEEVSAYPECLGFAKRIMEGLRSITVVVGTSIGHTQSMDAVLVLFRAAMNYRHEVFTTAQKQELESWVRTTKILNVILQEKERGKPSGSIKAGADSSTGPPLLAAQTTSTTGVQDVAQPSVLQQSTNGKQEEVQQPLQQQYDGDTSERVRAGSEARSHSDMDPPLFLGHSTPPPPPPAQPPPMADPRAEAQHSPHHSQSAGQHADANGDAMATSPAAALVSSGRGATALRGRLSSVSGSQPFKFKIVVGSTPADIHAQSADGEQHGEPVPRAGASSSSSSSQAHGRGTAQGGQQLEGITEEDGPALFQGGEQELEQGQIDQGLGKRSADMLSPGSGRQQQMSHKKPRSDQDHERGRSREHSRDGSREGSQDGSRERSQAPSGDRSHQEASGRRAWAYADGDHDRAQYSRGFGRDSGPREHGAGSFPRRHGSRSRSRSQDRYSMDIDGLPPQPTSGHHAVEVDSHSRMLYPPPESPMSDDDRPLMPNGHGQPPVGGPAGPRAGGWTFEERERHRLDRERDRDTDWDRERDRDRQHDEVSRLLHRGRLVLAIDLDHTLLTSVRLSELDIDTQEMLAQRLAIEASTVPDFQRELYRSERLGIWTKMRPGAREFLARASEKFELWACSASPRPYADAMASLLDPEDRFFEGRIIALGTAVDGPDGPSAMYNKRLMAGLEARAPITLALDDAGALWPLQLRLSLLAVERYLFFPTTRRRFGLEGRCLLALNRDECPDRGMLSSVWPLLERLHGLLLAYLHHPGPAGHLLSAPPREPRLPPWDMRNLLPDERRKVLAGCGLVFSRVFPAEADPQSHPLWRMAEAHGAACDIHVTGRTTHVVAAAHGTEKTLWAAQHGKPVVSPAWLECCCALWRKAAEDRFLLPVASAPAVTNAAETTTSAPAAATPSETAARQPSPQPA